MATTTNLAKKITYSNIIYKLKYIYRFNVYLYRLIQRHKMSKNIQIDNDIQKFMRAGQVAKYLGIGVSTVWSYSKQGRITAKKLSQGVTVFSIDEINREFELENMINNPKQENSN